MASVLHKDFWRDFIAVYRNFPETWKIKSEIYKNKVLKDKAYHVLLDKYRELEPNASLETVKKKINNMRSCYRRELKRLQRSEKSGAGTDDLYTSSLWYFEELSFLKDQESQLQGKSSIDNEYEDSSMETCEEDITFSSTPRKAYSDKQIKIQRNEILLKAVQHLEGATKNEDEATILSNSWAAMFRKLDERQKIYANRTISEVIYQGQLGKLNEYSHKVFEEPVINNPISTSNSISFSPSTIPENGTQFFPTTNSNIQRTTFSNVLLGSKKVLQQPQPKRRQIIINQVPTTNNFPSPNIVYGQAHSTDIIESDVTQQSSNQYNTIHELFSDAEFS